MTQDEIAAGCNKRLSCSDFGCRSGFGRTAAVVTFNLELWVAVNKVDSVVALDVDLDLV